MPAITACLMLSLLGISMASRGVIWRDSKKSSMCFRVPEPGSRTMNGWPSRSRGDRVPMRVSGCKVNTDTDIRLAMTGAMRQVFAEQPSEFDPRKALAPAKKAARAICEQRFEAFGCEGMAPKIRPVALDQMVRRYA